MHIAVLTTGAFYECRTTNGFFLYVFLFTYSIVLQVNCPYCTYMYMVTVVVLTLKVLVATIDAQWEGMGDVGSARYEPALLPPCPTIRVLTYSN